MSLHEWLRLEGSQHLLAGHEALDILLTVTAGTDASGHLYAQKNAFYGELIDKPQRAVEAPGHFLALQDSRLRLFNRRVIVGSWRRWL